MGKTAVPTSQGVVRNKCVNLCQVLSTVPGTQQGLHKYKVITESFLLLINKRFHKYS